MIFIAETIPARWLARPSGQSLAVLALPQSYRHEQFLRATRVLFRLISQNISWNSYSQEIQREWPKDKHLQKWTGSLFCNRSISFTLIAIPKQIFFLYQSSRLWLSTLSPINFFTSIYINIYSNIKLNYVCWCLSVRVSLYVCPLCTRKRLNRFPPIDNLHNYDPGTSNGAKVIK